MLRINFSADLNIRQIEDANDPAFAGFCHVYQRSFAEDPWNEHFTIEDVWNIWNADVTNNTVIVAEVESMVVGLSVARIASQPIPNPTISQFLRSIAAEIPFGPEEAVYMADMAVHRSFRRQGVGVALVRERLHWAHRNGIEWYTMRTASEGSKSAKLYDERLGSIRHATPQNVASEGIATSSEQRFYRYGLVADAINRL